MAEFSGTYKWTDAKGLPFSQEELRLDVDGRYPQMAVSGTGFSGLRVRSHWVAMPLTAVGECGENAWTAPIVFRDGTTPVPHTSVHLLHTETGLEVTFKGEGLEDRVRTFTFADNTFREVDFEYDTVDGLSPVLEVDTHRHPDHPGSLEGEILSVDTVFERAGFRVTRSGGDTSVPLSGARSDARWSDNEMHDAMQVSWSRFEERAQWALWTFFAGLHERGTSLGGIMFDSIGPTHRQGTAIFLDSFIANPPASDRVPDAWRQRMAFWTAVHEMGHAFNLLHAWQKHLGQPWIPQPSGYDQLSFMNYPYLYENGRFSDANTIRFFRDFEYRFTDDELLFLRHAPEPFVQMGGTPFGVNHAFEQANISPSPELRLDLRVNRDVPVFDFLEPVVVELKLSNISDQPQMLPEDLLSMTDRMTVVVQRRGGQQKSFHPFAHYCYSSRNSVLAAGDALYESLFLAVGSEGWLIDEPGYYTIRVCLHMPDEDVLSGPLEIRVVPPMDRMEEYLAQDFFSDEVGRVFAFDGSEVLGSANNTLHEVVDRLPDDHRAAIHARVALAMPKSRPYKKLKLDGDRPTEIVTRGIDEGCVDDFAAALGSNKKLSDHSAQTLGHIDYRYYSEQYLQTLGEMNETKKRATAKKRLVSTLEDRKVLPRVIDEVKKGD